MKFAIFSALIAMLFAAQANAKVMNCTAVVDATGHTNGGVSTVLPLKFSYVIRGNKILFANDDGVGNPKMSVNTCVGTLVVSAYKLSGSTCVPNRASIKKNGHIVILTDNADGDFAYYRCN